MNYFTPQKKKMLQNTAKRLIQNFIYDQRYDDSIEIKCIEIQSGYTTGNVTFLSKNMRKDNFMDDFIDELNTKFIDELGIYKKTKNVIENTDCYQITYGMWFSPENIKIGMKSSSSRKYDYDQEDQDEDRDDVEENHYSRQKRNKKKKYSKSICSSICSNCEIMIVFIVCILLCIIFGIIFFKN